jgi:hypothetical protein
MENQTPALEYKTPSPSSDNVSSTISNVSSSVSSSVSDAIESSGVRSIFDFSSYRAYDFFRIFMIVLIISFLGINFFGYLGRVTDAIRDFLKPILAFFGYGVAETTKSIVNVSAVGTKGAIDVTKGAVDVAAKGTKGAVNVAAGTVVGGVNLLEKGISKKGATMNKIDDNSKIDMKLLEKAVQNQNKPKSEDPEPDEAGSRTQSSKAKIKSGFCYIGEDRGFRRCISVGEGDKCMSGDIFPTDEICVNPSLRE